MGLISLKNVKGKFLLFICFAMLVNVSVAASRKNVLEWRVESSLEKLEKAPAYAGGRTVFTVTEKPANVIEVVKRLIPKQQSESQTKALRAADIISEIRSILNNDDIFNPDVSNITIDAIIQSDGKKTALIKNHWYAVGGIIDVPIVARDNLKELVSILRGLDKSLAEVVESQVSEKIKMVHNLSLSIAEINSHNVKFVDEQGQLHVINFRNQGY